MMRTYLRRAYRLRRIAALVCCGLFLQWLSNYIKWGQHPGYDLAYVVGYMDAYIGLAASALIGAVFFPSFACYIVVIVVSVLIAVPFFSSHLDFFKSLPPLVRLGVCLLIFYGVFSILFRPLIDRFLPTRPATFSTKATTNLGKEAVWDGFFSLPPDTAKRYNAKEIVFFEKEPDSEDTYRMRERIWNTAQIEFLFTITGRNRPHTASYNMTFLDFPASHPLRNMQVNYELKDTTTGGTALSITHTLPQTTHRSRFVFWILDHFGSAGDMSLNRLEKSTR